MNNNNPINQPLLENHDLENQNHDAQNVAEVEQFSLDIDGCVPFMMFMIIGPGLISAGIVDAYYKKLNI
jgi:hypothetical protein